MNRPFTEKEMSLLDIQKKFLLTDEKKEATEILLFTCQLGEISKLDHIRLGQDMMTQLVSYTAGGVPTSTSLWLD